MRAIILGGGARARHLDIELAHKADIELWCVNMQHVGEYSWLPRSPDKMFNLHKYELLKMYGYPLHRDATWAAAHFRNTDFFTMDKWPDGRMAKAKLFPVEELMKWPRGNYHCNSLDWLICYALYIDIKEVFLHGYNLDTEGMVEQASAAKCFEYWAGFATGRGMTIHVGEDSRLFGVYHPVRSNRIYGLDDCPAWSVEGEASPPYRYDDY